MVPGALEAAPPAPQRGPLLPQERSGCPAGIRLHRPGRGPQARAHSGGLGPRPDARLARRSPCPAPHPSARPRPRPEPQPVSPGTPLPGPGSAPNPSQLPSSFVGPQLSPESKPSWPQAPPLVHPSPAPHQTQSAFSPRQARPRPALASPGVSPAGCKPQAWLKLRPSHAQTPPHTQPNLPLSRAQATPPPRSELLRSRPRAFAVHHRSRPGSAPSSSHAPPAQATPRASRQPFACTSVEITVPKRLPFLTLSHPPRWPSCSLPFSTDSALPTYPSATERSRGRAAQALTPQLCSLSVAARPLFASASPGPFRRSTAPFRGRPSPCPAHRHDRTAGAPPLLCPVPPVPRTRPGPARLLPRRLSPLEAPACAGPPFWLNRRSSVKHALAADRLAKVASLLGAVCGA